MPEGPEIWRAADSLNKVMEDKKLTGIYFYFDELKKYEDPLKGKTVIRIEPRGKALLTLFENSMVMYSHNQLYGKWFIRKRGDEPDTSRQLRVALHNNTHSVYLYSASDIVMLEEKDVEAHSYIKKLGPDVLHPETTADLVLQRFRDKRFQNRKLTTLLLDQGFISGIGNYLRSEILFVAGVHPSCKLKDCSDKQIERLAEATRNLARRSYNTKGITNDKETVEALKRENVARSEYRFYVYKRTGSHCHKCGNEVRELKTGGRKVYFCLNCQPADR